MLPFLTDETIFKTQNYFVTVSELLAAAVISLCLSVGAGFHLLPVQADEPTAGPSGVSVGVPSSPASLLPDGVTTRKEADEWNADLIVVGTHGRSALGRLLMGSVSQKGGCGIALFGSRGALPGGKERVTDPHRRRC